MHTFSFGEIALIFGIVVILFGGSRLASIGKSLGEGIANFKKGMNQSNEELKQKETQQNTVQNPVGTNSSLKSPVIEAQAQVTSTTGQPFVEANHKQQNSSVNHSTSV